MEINKERLMFELLGRQALDLHILQQSCIQLQQEIQKQKLETEKHSSKRKVKS